MKMAVDLVEHDRTVQVDTSEDDIVSLRPECTYRAHGMLIREPDTLDWIADSSLVTRF